MLLNITTSYEWNRETGDSPVITYLSTDELLDLDDSYRNNLAEEYIKDSGDKIILLDVIESHHPNLTAFHEDFRDLLHNQYELEKEEYMSMQSEHNKLISELFERQIL